ncbi:hypothetical protein [Parasitella parasitica]|uniref:MIT domain-containing protein n=1 Tax=Parasitella parasitica TaxID=35722 RepID=A0A0B7NIS7_9FUNG|nr:hypothetical protein [Parasitella parasitica]
MSTLVSAVISQAEKLPIISNATSWLSFGICSNKRETDLRKSTKISFNTDYPDGELYDQTTLHYSVAPPTYDNVVKEDNKRFANTISTLWKRASFSSVQASVGNINSDIKTSQQTIIDTKQLEHAITLINVATDMNNNGNQQTAIDLYLMGLDRLMSALPLEDITVKSALEKKLIEIKNTYQLTITSVHNENMEQKANDGTTDRSQLSNFIINTAVWSAVSLKKSPIPGSYAINGIQMMDEKHQLRQRTWNLAASGIAKALEIDQQFEIHQMVTNAIYTGFNAFIKAGLAYAETPGYQQHAI